MAYPVTFTAFNWEDLPAESTAFDKENAQEAEKWLAKFTEEYEVHWIAPVKKLSELLAIKEPNALEGDVRLVEETKRLYGWNAAAKEWQPLSYWQSPVATKAALEALTDHEVGDARFVEETREVFIYLSGAWKPLVTPIGHVHTIETPTWVVAEKVTLSPPLLGPFIHLATNETKELIEVEAVLTKGTVTVELKIGGTLVKFETESTKLKLTTVIKAFKVETKPLVLGNKERVELIVSAEGGTPEGLALTAVVESVAKVV
jgi:hypothetical protein